MNNEKRHIFLSEISVKTKDAVFTAHQVWGDYDCYGEKELVKDIRKDTIKFEGAYIDPSDLCCHAVEQSDMACICRVITHEEEKHINVGKIIRLARECNKPVPSGAKCGSKKWKNNTKNH
ncbi:hypothetical protein SETIT_2G268600v2 [Setaria italica]|uniref:Bifunctional inhibitor/plant lipid transfer protein/seed storage helical domain-containing protein n=1 Tax=Setaria italica TaxID=4555 RepID=A0A368Q3H0_SETIT|nr:hypothetical protein SETIT_2G268600v2 [Setaria italica]